MRISVFAVEREPTGWLPGGSAAGLALVSVVCVALLLVIYRLMYPLGSSRVLHLVTYLRQLGRTARGVDGSGPQPRSPRADGIEPPPSHRDRPSRAVAHEPPDRAAGG